MSISAPFFEEDVNNVYVTNLDVITKERNFQIGLHKIK